MQRSFLHRNMLRVAALTGLIACMAMPGPVVAQAAPAGFEQAQQFADLDAFRAAAARDGGVIASLIAGDLSGLGPAQAVLIEHGPAVTRQQQLVVLVGGVDGGLRVAARTPVADAYNLDTSMRMERGSLFVELEALKGAWGSYQFKQQADGRLRLIGVRLHRYDTHGDYNDEEVGVDTDFNLVTGKMSFERVGDPRPLKAQVHGPACFLEEFDFGFYSCSENMMTAKGISADRLMNTP